MVSLLDIGDLRQKVTIRGKELEVMGITGEVFFDLLAEFPEMRKLMAGASGQLKPDDLIRQVPVAVASVIAAATGTPGDAKAIETARKLSLGEQATLVRAVWELTFPDGITSFIEALEVLRGQADASGLGPATVSPEQLNSSSATAIPEKTSGNTPQG